MREIIIATKNAGKVKDFETLFSPKGFKVKSLLDFPEIEDVEETGVTFAENATLKAEAISSALNKPVIADDSGLAIDALNGEPGVYSARYAGE
ncbi:MAG: non-canonical purine NTP pyrophosphatase, partial [Priestia megaterium]